MSHGDPARRAELERLTRYAHWLDASLGIPGTRLRLGVDALLGLVPVAGDWAGVLLSSFIVYRAVRLGVSRKTLLRMLFNLGLEGTIGAIPLVGDAFDVWFRANQRNVALLERDGSSAPAPGAPEHQRTA